MGLASAKKPIAHCAAGSLGGTLGRLNKSFRCLVRVQNRQMTTCSLLCQETKMVELYFIEPAELVLLNQHLRLMEDSWWPNLAPTPHFSYINVRLFSLKEIAKGYLAARHVRRSGEYQSLALALSKLKNSEQQWM